VVSGHGGGENALRTIDCMTDELTRLRSEIAEAKAERDVAQAQYD
jgi:hypothetical protein